MHGFKYFVCLPKLLTEEILHHLGYINNVIDYLSTGAVFFPSTVVNDPILHILFKYMVT